MRERGGKQNPRRGKQSSAVLDCPPVSDRRNHSWTFVSLIFIVDFNPLTFYPAGEPLGKVHLLLFLPVHFLNFFRVHNFKKICSL